MPSMNPTPRPTERGAVVVAHFFPRTFAWQIKTGRAVNREALAAVVLGFTPADFNTVRAKAAALANVPAYTEWLSGNAPRKFAKITASALKKGYCNDTRDIKGHRRIDVEKMLIRATLEHAAVMLSLRAPAVAPATV